MTKSSPIYNVVINSDNVSLEKIEPMNPNYANAKSDAIIRERDAIELIRNGSTDSGNFDGVYSFRYLETAKTFAMLHLKKIEEITENNLDRIQMYDGSTLSSD